MKVRVTFTVDVSDTFRKALNAYYGKGGKASSKELKLYFQCCAVENMDDVMWEYEKDTEE